MPVTTKRVDNILYVKAGSCVLGAVAKDASGYHVRKVGLATLMRPLIHFPTEQECVDHLVDCARTFTSKLNENLNPLVPIQSIAIDSHDER